VQQRQQQQQQQAQLQQQWTAADAFPVATASGQMPSGGDNTWAAEANSRQGPTLPQPNNQLAPPAAMSSRQPASQQSLPSTAVEQQQPLSFTDIIQAHEAKSFDYRVST
jgi:hypothetical protein